MGSSAPPEPMGVPSGQLEEVVPKSITTAEEIGQTCSICICELEEEETIRRLPICGHRFHACCIDK